MDRFTPYEYTLIALANANGLDKKLWNERLDWADNFVKLPFKDQLDFARTECKGEPILMAKTINAHQEILKGNETGFMTNLDATASGIQVMSAITGCYRSASRVNLVDNGLRNCLYNDMTHEMNSNHGTNTTRLPVKDAVMTKINWSLGE